MALAFKEITDVLLAHFIVNYVENILPNTNLTKHLLPAI